MLYGSTFITSDTHWRFLTLQEKRMSKKRMANVQSSYHSLFFFFCSKQYILLVLERSDIISFPGTHPTQTATVLRNIYLSVILGLSMGWAQPRCHHRRVVNDGSCASIYRLWIGDIRKAPNAIRKPWWWIGSNWPTGWSVHNAIIELTYWFGSCIINTSQRYLHRVKKKRGQQNDTISSQISMSHDT